MDAAPNRPLMQIPLPKRPPSMPMPNTPPEHSVITRKSQGSQGSRTSSSLGYASTTSVSTLRHGSPPSLVTSMNASPTYMDGGGNGNGNGGDYSLVKSRTMAPVVLTNFPEMPSEDIILLIKETILANIGSWIEWHMYPLKGRDDGFIIALAQADIAYRFINCMNGLIIENHTLEAKLYYPLANGPWQLPELLPSSMLPQPHNRVYVSNLPFRALIDNFCIFCFKLINDKIPRLALKVTEIKVPLRYDDSQYYGSWRNDDYLSKGYALVTFSDHELAWAFIDVINGVWYDRRQLGARFDRFPDNHSTRPIHFELASDDDDVRGYVHSGSARHNPSINSQDGSYQDDSYQNGSYQHRPYHQNGYQRNRNYHNGYRHNRYHRNGSGRYGYYQDSSSDGNESSSNTHGDGDRTRYPQYRSSNGYTPNHSHQYGSRNNGSPPFRYRNGGYSPNGYRPSNNMRRVQYHRNNSSNQSFEQYFDHGSDQSSDDTQVNGNEYPSDDSTSWS